MVSQCFGVVHGSYVEDAQIGSWRLIGKSSSPVPSQSHKHTSAGNSTKNPLRLRPLEGPG